MRTACGGVSVGDLDLTPALDLRAVIELGVGGGGRVGRSMLLLLLLLAFSAGEAASMRRGGDRDGGNLRPLAKCCFDSAAVAIASAARYLGLVSGLGLVPRAGGADMARPPLLPSPLRVGDTRDTAEDPTVVALVGRSPRVGDFRVALAAAARAAATRPAAALYRGVGAFDRMATVVALLLLRTTPVAGLLCRRALLLSRAVGLGVPRFDEDEGRGGEVDNREAEEVREEETEEECLCRVLLLLLLPAVVVVVVAVVRPYRKALADCRADALGDATTRGVDDDELAAFFVGLLRCFAGDFADLAAIFAFLPLVSTTAAVPSSDVRRRVSS